MKETRKVLITILLVGISLVTVAAADPTMSVSQQPDDVGLNETFTAEVTVNPAGSGIYAASYDLYFDAAILEAIKQTQGDFLSHGGVETLEIINEFNNTRGKITYSETRTDDKEATEPGILASITFKVIGEGISDLTLRNVGFAPYPSEPEPTPTPTPTSTPIDDGGSSSHNPGGSSGYIAAPAATPTETAALSATSTDAESETNAADVAGDDTESGDDAAPAPSAGSTPAKTPVKKTSLPSRPMSAIPGFAATFAILGLLAVTIALKSRGK